MKRICIALILFGSASSAFSTELPKASEVDMGPVTIARGGSLSANWVTECQTKVDAWKTTTQGKLLSLRAAGTLQTTPEFSSETSYDRDQDSSCYTTTETLLCQAITTLEDTYYRLARLVRTLKLGLTKRDQRCQELLAQVRALPETLEANAIIRDRDSLGLRSDCHIISLAVINN